jgi:hypothetical protein
MNEQFFKDIEEALAWAEGTHCAITVCDLEGKVIVVGEDELLLEHMDGVDVLHVDDESLADAHELAGLVAQLRGQHALHLA